MEDCFTGFSALQRAEIAEIVVEDISTSIKTPVSVLFNEPKLLKYRTTVSTAPSPRRFSALQRAEIAEIKEWSVKEFVALMSFSALQRAEIAEIIVYSQ